MISHAPDIAPLHRAVLAALEGSDAAHAHGLALRLLEAAPDLADAHFLAGLAEAKRGRVSAALPLVAEAVRRAPSADYLAQQARLLLSARRDADARAAADRAAALDPADALTLDTIGCVYARLNDHAPAAALFERAVAAAPDNIGYRFNLASALGFLGRFDDADAAYEAILLREPGHARAHLGLAGLRRQTPERNHVHRIEAALAVATDPVERLRLHHAAAKSHEDLGAHTAAFDHLHIANSAYKAALGFDVTADRAIFAVLEQAFANPGFAAGEGADGAPIFVLGLPRTGTTLVDRILGAHPEVTSAGELQAMPLAVKQAAATRSRLILDPETIAAAGLTPPAAIGRAYLDHARQHHAGGRFTDKLPQNFLYAGFIAQALPQARIVCLRRDPMDSVWSNYKHLFATTSSYYRYSYDLLDTAAYYVMFDRLMAYWDRRFPGRILSLGYEALTADQEGETRRLLDHCGLPWDAACLDFHTSTAAVATPSAAQVRRPMNRDAVGRWRAYEAQLAPVRAYLEGHGIEVEA